VTQFSGYEPARAAATAHRGAFFKHRSGGSFNSSPGSIDAQTSASIWDWMLLVSDLRGGRWSANLAIVRSTLLFDVSERAELDRILFLLNRMLALDTESSAAKLSSTRGRGSASFQPQGETSASRRPRLACYLRESPYAWRASFPGGRQPPAAVHGNCLQNCVETGVGGAIPFPTLVITRYLGKN